MNSNMVKYYYNLWIKRCSLLKKG